MAIQLEKCKRYVNSHVLPKMKTSPKLQYKSLAMAMMEFKEG